MSASSDYLRPASLGEALEARASGEFRVIAGCTDVYPATDRQALSGPVLDVTGIDELRGISRTSDGIEIGATTTWSAIREADLPPAFDALQLASREVGALQIQNRGTVGGNLCNASPAADGVPPLLVLDASVILRSATGERVLPLQDFLKGPRQIDLRPDELLTKITVPAPALEGQSHFLKLGARKYLVISIAMVAVRIVGTATHIEDARVAVGACGPVATRLPDVESALIGGSLDPGLISDEAVEAALKPIDDVRASASYRAETAATLIRRALGVVRPESAAA